MAWKNNRPAPSSRGTGHEHRKARAAWAEQHDPSHPCVRCGHPLGPMGPWLHLDHSRDRMSYLGFAHGVPRKCPWCGKYCNQSAAGKEARDRQTVIAPRL